MATRKTTSDRAGEAPTHDDFEGLWEEIDAKVTQAHGICMMLVGHHAVEGPASNAAWAAETLLSDAASLLARLRDEHKREAAHG